LCFCSLSVFAALWPALVSPLDHRAELARVLGLSDDVDYRAG